MGGALWWLLAAAVSGSWLMLLALVLSRAAWAVFPAAVCGGWVSQSRDRKKKTLVRLGLAVLLLLILRFGGQLLLGLAGLSWRRWVKSALDLGLLGAASVLAAKTAGRLIDDPARRDWQRWCSALWAGLIIFSAVGLAGMKLLWTDLGDRVTQWEGQKAVAEYVGVFHEKVYPYRNLLVRGNEVIYEWWD